MNKFVLYLIASTLVVWIFGGSYWLSNQYTDINDIKEGFHFNHGEFNSSSPDNFFFDHSSGLLSIPKQVQPALESLAAYISAQPELKVIVAGLTAPDENYQGVFPDLGIARAEAFKLKLHKLGIDKNRIKTKTAISPILKNIDNRVYNAITIQLKTTNPDARNFTQLPDATAKKKKQPTPPRPESLRKLNLYFPKSVYKLKMVPEMEHYFGEVLAFIKSSPDTKILLTGHTDNKGDAKQNMRLSKYRARTVRNFLVRNGFAKSRIIIDYKGPHEPIASNDTEDGRTKNRRVEMRVIKG